MELRTLNTMTFAIDYEMESDPRFYHDGRLAASTRQTFADDGPKKCFLWSLGFFMSVSFQTGSFTESARGCENVDSMNGYIS